MPSSAYIVARLGYIVALEVLCRRSREVEGVRGTLDRGKPCEEFDGVGGEGGGGQLIVMLR